MVASVYAVETGRIAISRSPGRSRTAEREHDLHVECIGYARPSQVRFTSDEDDLASAFAQRDQKALAEVYRTYAATLYAVAVRVLDVKQDAEDCVHDTLLRIWSKPNTYCRERGTLSSLLVIAVRNDALSRRRMAAKHHKIEQRLDAPVLVEDFTIRLRDHVEYDKLWVAIETLEPNLREPIVRAYMRYQTHEQISRELNVPLGTIKSRLIIGLRKLRGVLIARKQRA